MKKLLITILALTLALVMSVTTLGCNVVELPEQSFTSSPAEVVSPTLTKPSTSAGTASTAKKNEVQRVAMAFSAGVAVDATETEPAHVTKRLEAVVEPITAPQEVDYTVAWQEGASLASEDVSTYLKVEQDSDGSLGATVKCYKAFGADTIVITCTTRNRNKQDVCLVTFEGLTKDITITHSFEKIEDTRGTFYYVPVDNSYKLDVTISSIFGDDYTSNVDITVNFSAKGTGTVYVLYELVREVSKITARVYPMSVQEFFSSTSYRKINGPYRTAVLDDPEYDVSDETEYSLVKYEEKNALRYLTFNIPDFLNGKCAFGGYMGDPYLSGVEYLNDARYMFMTTVYKEDNNLGITEGGIDRVYICDAEGNQTDTTTYTAEQIIEMNKQALSDVCFEVYVIDSVSGSESEVIRFWPYWPENAVHDVSGLPENIVI